MNSSEVIDLTDLCIREKPFNSEEEAIPIREKRRSQSFGQSDDESVEIVEDHAE